MGSAAFLIATECSDFQFEKQKSSRILKRLKLRKSMQPAKKDNDNLQGVLLPLLLCCIVSYNVCHGCETLPSTIHIIKEIYAQSGQLERTCEGEVAVSKCEGSCASKVRPSAVSHSGFVKDCQCCRETSLRSREIVLTKCFDPDGKNLTGDKETFTIALKEPADCRCYRCGETTTSMK